MVNRSSSLSQTLHLVNCSKPWSLETRELSTKEERELDWTGGGKVEAAGDQAEFKWKVTASLNVYVNELSENDDDMMVTRDNVDNVTRCRWGVLPSVLIWTRDVNIKMMFVTWQCFIVTVSMTQYGDCLKCCRVLMSDMSPETRSHPPNIY